MYTRKPPDFAQFLHHLNMQHPKQYSEVAITTCFCVKKTPVFAPPDKIIEFDKST